MSLYVAAYVQSGG